MHAFAGSSRAVVRLTPRKISASEVNETLDGQLFLEIDRQIEPTVEFNIFLHSDDVKAPKILTVSPEDGLRIPIPLQIVDDMIAERGDCTRLFVASVPRYNSVYTIDSRNSSATICIKDNDSMWLKSKFVQLQLQEIAECLQQCEKQKALHHSIYGFSVVWVHPYYVEGSRHFAFHTVANILHSPVSKMIFST